MEKRQRKPAVPTPKRAPSGIPCIPFLDVLEPMEDRRRLLLVGDVEGGLIKLYNQASHASHASHRP